MKSTASRLFTFAAYILNLKKPTRMTEVASATGYSLGRAHRNVKELAKVFPIQTWIESKGHSGVKYAYVSVPPSNEELLARVLELEQERENTLNYCRELEGKIRVLESTREVDRYIAKMEAHTEMMLTQSVIKEKIFGLQGLSK